MSTQARSITVNQPIRWFLVGVATAVVAGALTAGLALAILHPATQPGELGNGPAPASLLDAGYRLQRAGEINAGQTSISGDGVLGLTDQRRGEINAGETGVSGGVLRRTDQRAGEITTGETGVSGGVLGLTDQRRGEIGSGD